MIVHIGFPKTGTTFLQTNLFKRLADINLVGYNECQQVFEALRYESSLNYDANAESSHFSQDPKSLYSFESLAGEMGTGQYNAEIAHRLRAVGFKKVIISIRHQSAIMNSVYSQYIQQGGTLKANDFFNESLGRFRWSYLDYNAVYSHYVAVFGEDNVHVVVQEMLRTKPENELKDISTFVGSEISEPIDKGIRGNASLSPNALKILRYINHFTRNYYRPSSPIHSSLTTWKFRQLLGHLPRFSSRKHSWLNSEISAKARKRYSQGNVALNASLSGKLSTLDYYLS